MPGITVTLVDRTGGASLSHENFKTGIMHALEDILGDLIYSASEATVVNARWVSLQKSEQTGTGFRLKAAGDFGGKRHLISLQFGTRFRRFRHP